MIAGAEPQKDELRKLHDRLCQECNSAQDEYKRLRGVIEQLSREYEDSKEIDFFRRYGMLKAMIKRSIMHLTLSKDDRNHVLIGNTAAREKEEQKKRDERLSGSYHSIYRSLQKATIVLLQNKNRSNIEMSIVLDLFLNDLVFIQRDIEENERRYNNMPQSEVQFL